MKLIATGEMRELDKRTIEEFGTPSEVLMERAGHGVADTVRRMMDLAGFHFPIVHLIAGRGNNGGDAYVAGRILKEAGIDVEVWIAGAVRDLKGDAMKHFCLMKAAGVSYEELDTQGAWDEALLRPVLSEIIVDGILGTGTNGPARGPAAGAIQYINSRSPEALVVAIDIPSGLDADSGQPSGDAVLADITATIGLPKKGLVRPEALDYIGSVEVIDIGIPKDFIDETECDSECELIFPTDLRSLLSRRARASHKGQFGHALLIGGAAGYAGAIGMAARAAVRSGAGLISALVPHGIVPIIAGTSLETMVIGAEETASGSLSMENWRTWRSGLDAFDAVLLGPGMTRSSDTLTLAREILRESPVPLVIDADAIAVFENQPDWIAKARCPVVLTPHPGELGMLFGLTAEEVQADRVGIAVAAAKFTGATVILKGAGTIVAEVDRPTGINLTGNPGMATGGSGDVLAGLVTGLMAQGLAPYDAARLAVYLHGRAGDLVAWRKSQSGLSATDLIDELAYAFRDITLR